MTDNELISALDHLKVETGSLVCLGCGYEHNCSTRGCAVLAEARCELQMLEKSREDIAQNLRPDDTLERLLQQVRAKNRLERSRPASERGGITMSKRKYRPGQQIHTLDELANQDFIYFLGRITPCGWFMNWQLRLTTNYLNNGWIRSAVKIEEEQEDNHAEIH